VHGATQGHASWQQSGKIHRFGNSGESAIPWESSGSPCACLNQLSMCPQKHGAISWNLHRHVCTHHVVSVLAETLIDRY